MSNNGTIFNGAKDVVASNNLLRRGPGETITYPFFLAFTGGSDFITAVGNRCNGAVNECVFNDKPSPTSFVNASNANAPR